MGNFCDETEANTKQVQKCNKKMEVDEGLILNTVACLRGRLQAERQASKVAKEKAESMANKTNVLKTNLDIESETPSDHSSTALNCSNGNKITVKPLK
ncbi:hypothetical protein P8452_50465 [Trifolium repens]|nr:hypothetical protein P8452_50465 [Trifolium repens]